MLVRAVMETWRSLNAKTKRVARSELCHGLLVELGNISSSVDG